MAINTKNRSELKAYFVKNAIPTEANFAELVDAQLNQADDGVFKLGDDPLSVVAVPGDQKRVLRLYEQYPASNPSWTLSLEPRTDVSDATTAASGLGFDAPDGTNRLFLDASGKLGLGTTKPSDKLTINDGDLRIEGGKYRRLKIISDTHWAGIELVARDADGKGGHPHIDFTHGDLDSPNFGVRLYSPANGKLMVEGASLGIGRDPEQELDVNGSAWIRGLISTTLGLKITGSHSAHIDTDGSFYRKGGQVWITVDDHLYIRDKGASGDDWTAHFNTDSGSLAVTGNLIAKGGSVQIGGDWKLVADGEHLYIKNGSLTIARFSTSHDRLQVYRNRDGKAPYWYYNSVGNHN
jgi:hypothetical protein